MGSKNDSVCGFLPGIHSESPQNAIGRLKLSKLKPTQNAVGMEEVNVKVEKIKRKSDDKLTDYLLQRTIPIIVGNGKCMEMTLEDIRKADPDEYSEKIAYANFLASSPEAAGLPGFVGRSS